MRLYLIFMFVRFNCPNPGCFFFIVAFIRYGKLITLLFNLLKIIFEHINKCLSQNLFVSNEEFRLNCCGFKGDWFLSEKICTFPGLILSNS